MDVTNVTNNYKREVLSMDVDPSNEVVSEYRILLGGQIKYILVDPGTYDSDVLSFPPDLFDQLPEFPLGDWKRAHIYRQSDKLFVEVSFTSLAGIRSHWHSNVVDVLTITLEERLCSRVQVVNYGSKLAVAKIARFEFEIPLVENETALYQAIDGHYIGPTFLGHLVEHGRIMGFLKVDGQPGEIGDLEACQKAVQRLHSLGIVHGDLNKNNFIVSSTGVTLVDFENATKNGGKDAMRKEYSELGEQLTETTGRGGASVPESEWSDIE